MKRVGIVGLLQESNTFLAGTTRRAHFEADLLLRGEAIREVMAETPHEVGGFFTGLAEAEGEIEAVPLFLARALPYGRIDQADFEKLVEELLASVAGAGPLDGILAAPHGATVAHGHDDADGWWLGRLRELIGPDVILIASLDPHANLSPAMVAATDAIVAYRSNPHLDQRETGIRAARLMIGTLAGKLRPVQAAAYPPMSINIRSQNTGESPMREFYETIAALGDRPGIVSHSVILGFPYADVAEMGSSVLVVADGDAALAEETAAAMGEVMWQRREAFEPVQTGVGEAIGIALERAARPVVLLDMGDNVGGGSPGDATAIAHEWRRSGDGSSLFVCLHDPAAVESAEKAGSGGRFDQAIGDPADPLPGSWQVRSLHDGIFHEAQARHGGFSVFDQGATAVLDHLDGKIVAMVTTRRMAPFSLAQMTAFGLDPAAFAVIVAKGVIAPQAAYAPVAKGGFVHVDSPGVTRADMTKLVYEKRRRPLFPFER
ncbi:MAG: M81 family metallopeptidase [Verrucomicrobiales bacterium]|nr:M81 family metallopeptidase [Verrucomicrobiales bacterium]